LLTTSRTVHWEEDYKIMRRYEGRTHYAPTSLWSTLGLSCRNASQDI